MGCCTPVLGPIENYYTKYQTDERIEEAISGITGSTGCCITPEEVDEKIASAKTEIEAEIPSLSGYATEQWVEDKHYITGVDLSDYALKSEIPTVPTSNTAFTNDAGYLTEHQSLSGYATEQWVQDQGYITGVDLSDYAKLEDIPYSDIEAISGDVNTVSGDVITLSGEVASITTSGMTSGQVQTMIDNSISGKQDTLIAGDYITIDTANTISTSGLVTVVDNEVPAFSAENLVRYNGGYPSSSGQQYTYNQSTDAVLVYFAVQGSMYRYKTKIQVVDTGDTKTSGETNNLKVNQMTAESLNPLPDYLTVENVGNRMWLFKANEGYRISHLSSLLSYDGDPYSYEEVYISGTPTTYMSGQSESVIENEIYPELASKANKIQAGDGIIITRDAINSADTINIRLESTITSASTYKQAPSAKAVYNALSNKADTTYVNNNFMAKSQIWCGSEQEWSQISGSTTNGTIYLVY